MHSDIGSCRIALVGPPNAGKTSLFNWLTGSRYHSVNYPGATVEYLKGETMSDYGRIHMVLDTPGIRSLRVVSPEEAVTEKILFEGAKEVTPNVIVVPVDVTQMSRHLLLVQQLKETGAKVVVALTMVDLLKTRGYQLNKDRLSSLLGLPVVEIDGRLGGGVKALVEEINSFECQGVEPLKKVPTWSDERIQKAYEFGDEVTQNVLTPINKESANKSKEPSTKNLLGDPESLKLDRYLMHPVFGVALFLMIMISLFSAIFWFAAPFMDFIDEGFASTAEWALSLAPDNLFAQFIANGLITGAGSVLVFVPQILILFLGLGVLEDTGYLARAATLVDKPLSKIGLNGRSFVPLLSGYACAIPAMLAARTISSRKERLITIFVIPLMSCSARLPVYALLLGFLFPGNAFYAGLALTSIYIGSVFFGGIGAAIATKVLPADKASWLMMELPSYRRPQLRVILRTSLDRTYSYIRRAGSAIIMVSIIIWLATTFPNNNLDDESQVLESSYAAQVGQVFEPVMQPLEGDWRVGVGLLSAFAAREVFVSTMALLLRAEGEDDDEVQNSLLGAMREAKMASGEPLFTIPSVVGLIVFFIIALQCLPTTVVANKESGSRKFALVQLITFNGVAYIIAVIVVQSLKIIGL